MVVGKLGYSTVAEVYHSGAAFAFVRRPRFPESPVLERFVGSKMDSVDIAADALKRGSWSERLDSLLDGPRPCARRRNGADEAALLILEEIGSSAALQ